MNRIARILSSDVPEGQMDWGLVVVWLLNITVLAAVVFDVWRTIIG